MPPYIPYRWIDLPRLFALALAYALLVMVVLSFLTTDGNVSPVWLPSGLGLAALLLGGTKYLPGVFIGAVGAYLFLGRSAPVAFFIAFSNCIEPLLAVLLLARVREFDPALRRSEDLLWLIVIGTPVSLLAASIGVGTLVGAGLLPHDAIVPGLLAWWRGNLFGIVLLTPAVLIWKNWPMGWLSSGGRRLESAAFVLLAFATSLVAFRGWTLATMSGVPLGYLMFLFVSWGALRFGRHGVTLILLLSAIQGILGTLDGTGFFVGDLSSGLSHLWLYIMSMAAVGFVLSATMLQHKRDVRALSESEALWSFALEGGGDCVWDWNLGSNEVILSKGGKAMFGFSDDEIGNSMMEWNARVHPDDVGRMLEQVRAFFHSRDDRFHAEYRVRCKDESWKWILTRGMVAHRTGQGIVTRMIGTHTDLTERKHAEETIRRQAYYDALTQLPNRRLFRDRLEQAMRQSRREHAVLALMLIDLDHFKEINDTLGHDVGDQLLVDAARRIQGCMRESDTVARMGGDEFVVILPCMENVPRISQIAQQVADKLAEPFLLQGERAYVSASIGITLHPDDASDIDALLKHADQAMYVAKHLGGNRYSYFTRSLQESAQRRMRLISDLRDALMADQFRVYYQPIIHLPTGRIHKAEALLRWMHPVRGMVSPGEFIPLAEETGLIIEIGDWVLQQALQQVRHLRASCHASFQISVNKSPVQFRNENATQAAAWLQRISGEGFQPDSLVVEITEGVLMDNNSDIQGNLLALRDAGVQVAIDDFGTGYSSLAYLNRFHIDYLKIDQAFVSNLDRQPDDLVLCEAIIAMAHKLGLKVVAEGVETAQQRDLLLQAGCDYAQGFLFSPAVAGEALEALMRSDSLTLPK